MQEEIITKEAVLRLSIFKNLSLTPKVVGRAILLKGNVRYKKELRTIVRALNEIPGVEKVVNLANIEKPSAQERIDSRLLLPAPSTNHVRRGHLHREQSQANHESLTPLKENNLPASDMAAVA